MMKNVTDREIDGAANLWLILREEKRKQVVQSSLSKTVLIDTRE